MCDAYDAMVSDRPYRTAMSSEQAVLELRLCAGTQFDPAVVDAMVTALTRPEAAPSSRFAHGDPQPAGMPFSSFER